MKYIKTYEEIKGVNRIESSKEVNDKSKITDLNFSNQNLTKLPDLSEYINLEILSCHGNQLTELPKLPESLIKLHCPNNQLSNLPELPKTLKELECYNNQLSNLPELPKTLKELECSNNQLSNLPELPKTLKGLICSNNQLTELPKLPKLRQLYCKNNRLIYDNLEEYNEWKLDPKGYEAKKNAEKYNL